MFDLNLSNEEACALRLSGSDGGVVTRELFPASVHAPPRKGRRGPRSRSSQYRGVTFYRRTGRWESHIWDCGKQVYLGGFDTALSAARAYDRAAIKFRGVEADINFTLTEYDQDIKQMKNMSKEEFVHTLRRQTTGFSKCRGLSARNKAYAKEAVELSSYDNSLDLKLGISTPSSKEIGNLGGFHFHIQNANMFKERASQEQTGLSSISEEVRWAWQMHDQIQVCATPTTAAAASSGFSSPVVSNSASSLSLCFSSNATDISQISSLSPRH